MKQRGSESPAADESSEDSLCRAFLALDSMQDMRAFVRDLCTPAELEAMTDRWRVVPMILEGIPYREIYDRTGVSITTVGRVARFINHGNNGYLAAIAAVSKPARRSKVTS